MRNRELVKAVAYLRTSSTANVGPGKDSDARQREAIARCAAAFGYELVGEFYDPGVSGADPIDTRPGFALLLDRVEANGVRTVLVEDASRFARDLLTQELGILSLIKLGVRVITSNGEDLTNADDPMKKAMRQIAGAFAELEKARLVHKLKVARDRKREATGKCGGRKSYAERSPDMVTLAKKLRRYPVNGRRRTLDEVAQELQARGFVAASGKPFNKAAIKRMVDRLTDSRSAIL